MLNFYNTCMCLTAMLYCLDDTNSVCVPDFLTQL